MSIKQLITSIFELENNLQNIVFYAKEINFQLRIEIN